MKNFIFGLIMAIFLVGCDGEDESAKAPQQEKPYSVGEEIVLKSVFGKELTLVRKDGGFVVKGDEDKVLVFDIFGTFCPPCQKEAPELTKFQVDNVDWLTIIALTHFEDVTNEYVIQKFAQPHNAYYFISNDMPTNDRISAQLLADINYQRLESVPIKMVSKNAKYYELTDVDTGRFGVKYYLGGIKMQDMKNDLEKIKNAKN